MQTQRILIISPEQELSQTMQALLPRDCHVEVLSALKSLAAAATPPLASLALVDAILLTGRPLNAPELAPLMSIPVVLLLPETMPLMALNPLLLQLHVLGVLIPPYTTDDNRTALAAALRSAPLHMQKIELEQQLASANQRLDQRLQEINVIYTVGKSVAVSLNLNDTLPRIVSTAVNLTRAEEGFILLQEEGGLYLRASHRFNEPEVELQHTPAKDPVAQRVIQSGRPVMLKRETRLATGNLVKGLLYLPVLRPGGGAIGVLGVVNRERAAEFTEAQLFTLSAIADFAAIALENARLFGEIQREQHRLRSIVEEATEAVLITDERDCLLLWSRTAAETFAIPENAVGQPVVETLHHAQLLNLFQQAIEETNGPQAEITLSDGRVMNAQITTVPQLGRVAVMQDITKMKELDRIKTEFVHTVSHDLRTPLTTIQGYIMLLERAGPLTEMQRAFVRKTLDSLADITDLITDLLDLGRIEADYEMIMEDLQLEQLLKEVDALHRPQAEKLGVTLHTTLPAAPLQMRGNAYRMQQALVKVVDNAIKYNRPGGQVTLETQDIGQHIIVRISDNGIGIPLADQAHIFERFYRIALPETENIRGTGLGLAIVKSIIERHHGRIWVESAVGTGSCFSLLLPKNG